MEKIVLTFLMYAWCNPVCAMLGFTTTKGQQGQKLKKPVTIINYNSSENKNYILNYLITAQKNPKQTSKQDRVDAINVLKNFDALKAREFEDKEKSLN